MSPNDAKDVFQQFVRDVLRGTAFALHTRIVQRTPIDTGRARSSWNLNENEADPAVTPPLRTEVNPISHEILFLAEAGAEPLSAAQALVAAQSQQQKISRTATVIVISNNLPYIEQLENGSSRQAPAGMVTVSTTQGAVQAIVDSQVALYRV